MSLGIDVKQEMDTLVSLIGKVQRGEFESMEFPETGVQTITTADDGLTEVFVENGACKQIMMPREVLTAPDAEFDAHLVEVLNAALDEHRQAVHNTLLEAGGAPGIFSELWQAQAYLLSAMGMQMEEQR